MSLSKQSANRDNLSGSASPFWKGRRVVLTGGTGFLGSYVAEKLSQRGCQDISIPRSKDYDLRTLPAITRLFEETRPDIVIHLAAQVGGIGANRAKPGEFFYNNLVMGVQLMEQARLFKVDKFMAVGTV